MTTEREESSTSKRADQGQRDRRGQWSSAAHAVMVVLHPFSVFLLPWRVGAPDARMAIGLMQSDPMRRRRLLTAACYLSVGAVKVLLLTFALVLLAVILIRVFDLRAKVGVGWFGQAFSAIVSASVIAGAGLIILTLAASLFAAVVRQKLWIDEWADPATAPDGRWPPVSGRYDARNIVGVLGVVPSTIVPLIVVLLLIDNPHAGVLLLTGLSGTFPAIWIARRVVARTPADCYPETPSMTSESTEHD